MVQVGVDAGGIGLEVELCFGRQGLEVPGRVVGEPQGAHELVDAERGRADHLGQAPRGGAPPEVHLPDPVLGMGEAQREGRIELVIGTDGDEAAGIAQHLDWGGQPL